MNNVLILLPDDEKNLEAVINESKNLNSKGLSTYHDERLMEKVGAEFYTDNAGVAVFSVHMGTYNIGFNTANFPENFEMPHDIIVNIVINYANTTIILQNLQE